MNVEQLLQHFERVSEAPGAIPRLRRFILHLAVRGKLVEQDPSNESVVKRYQNEMGGKDIPETWRVLNFGKYCNIEGGSQPPKSLFIDEPRNGYIRLLQIRDLGDRPLPVYIPSASARSLCREGEILIGRYGASVGKIFWAQNGAYNVAMAKFIWPDDALIPQFAFLLLKSEHLQGKLNMATRSAQAGFNKSDLAPINFPLPPLPEQHRIVAKVDELMSLCDQLEAAKAEREETCDSLVAASLQGLSQPAEEEETFREHAQITLNILPRITTRTTHIKQLRQTILDLAVRGKLVPQDPSDEPAAELLKRIAAEKARLRQSDQGDARNVLSAPDETPFPIPNIWKWVRFADYALDISTGPFGSALHQSDYVLKGIPLVNPSHMINDKIVPDEKVTVSNETANRLLSYRMKEGDIVMARRGEVGRAALVTRAQDGWLCGTGSFFLRFTKEVPRRNVLLLLRSELVRSYLSGNAVGTTMTNLNHGILKQMPLPIAPLAEQYRIVAKVDELMAICDQLEAQLTASEQDGRRFLEAVLQDALAPAMAVTA